MRKKNDREMRKCEKRERAKNEKAWEGEGNENRMETRNTGNRERAWNIGKRESEK